MPRTNPPRWMPELMSAFVRLCLYRLDLTACYAAPADIPRAPIARPAPCQLRALRRTHQGRASASALPRRLLLTAPRHPRAPERSERYARHRQNRQPPCRTFRFRQNRQPPVHRLTSAAKTATTLLHIQIPAKTAPHTATCANSGRIGNRFSPRRARRGLPAAASRALTRRRDGARARPGVRSLFPAAIAPASVFVASVYHDISPQPAKAHGMPGSFGLPELT